MSRILPATTNAALLLLALAQAGCGLILGLDEYSLRASCPVAECGVFVALEGSDTNEGTRERPVRTIARGIAMASGGGVVHLCAQSFPDAIDVPAGITLKGGLNCSGEWEYIGDLARTTLAPGPDMIPLRLLGGAGVTRIEDVDARAADASAPGGSSIAVIAESATAEITKCEFTAGRGAAGVKGATPNEDVGSIGDPDDLRVQGIDGAAACAGGASGNPGGAEKANQLCGESIGGEGGFGSLGAASGLAGADGAPAAGSTKGLGGAGDTGAGCEPGAYGQDGAVGSTGLGATGLGAIDIQGYNGEHGASGGRGAPGQGGGGGGGGRGKLNCNGPSGGSGGAGGCGGYGGLGGAPGGASIVVVSINSVLTFSDARLTAGDGGNGGDGGDGQIGGIGGNGGIGGVPTTGTTKGCTGGDGGSGGLGGRGGGGRGGHSFGIAFTGKAPLTPATTIIDLGAPGAGGLGADMSGQGEGAAGEAADTIELPAGM